MIPGGPDRNALIVGADGGIGSALSQHLSGAGWNALETTRRPETCGAQRSFLDLTATPDWTPPARVDIAFLCAAVTSLEECRQDPASTARVNVENTVWLARRLVETGAFVVLLSTSAVYDGSSPCRLPADPPCPLTEYGRQKAAAEAQILALGGAAVVRLTKVVHSRLPILMRWRQDLGRGDRIRAFSDMVIAPLSLSFTVEALLRVAETRPEGILQVSADEDISYAAVARRLAERIGTGPARVESVPAASAGLPPEMVPRHTTLDTRRLREELGIRVPGAWTAIDEALPL